MFNLDGVLTVMVIPVFSLPQLPRVVMALTRPVLLLVILAGQDVNQRGKLETHYKNTKSSWHYYHKATEYKR